MASMSESTYPYDPAKFIPPPEWRPAHVGPLAVWGVLGGVGLCFVLVDLSFCWVAGNQARWSPWEYVMTINIAGIGAQASLLAVYAVFGPGKASARHLVAISLGCCCLVFWWLGYLMAFWQPNTVVFPAMEKNVVFAMMLPIPAMFFAGCIPLWIFRTLFRWRIERSDSPSTRPPQLSIGGILLATF